MTASDEARFEISHRRFDVTPGGSRFLIVEPGGAPGIESLTLVQSWASGLER